MQTTDKKSGRKGLIAVIALIVLIAAFALAYTLLSPSASEGSKTLTIQVIDDNGETTSYTVKTDAEYLRQAMDETDGLTYEGTESEYGMYVETVNGITADYNTDGAYWAFYVDGEYCNYGIDSQPVNDGEVYTIEYTVYTY
ncbi:MAG: DUF4430 domain-containing protein [Lachnospiraceae bacterium]|nr:DUF4430 domain-containing protein [Lachnospiraceae bacterium]